MSLPRILSTIQSFPGRTKGQSAVIVEGNEPQAQGAARVLSPPCDVHSPASRDPEQSVAESMVAEVSRVPPGTRDGHHGEARLADRGAAGHQPLPAPRWSEVIPFERARRVEPVIDLIPVDGAQHPRVARVLPLEPVEAVMTNAGVPGVAMDGEPTEFVAAVVDRLPERVERTTEVLQALAVYLRSVEADPVAGGAVSAPSIGPAEGGATVGSPSLGEDSAAESTSEVTRVLSSGIAPAFTAPPPPVRIARLPLEVTAGDEQKRNAPRSSTTLPPRVSGTRLARFLAAVRSPH